MYIPISSPSRVERLKQRTAKTGSRFKLAVNSVVVLVATLTLTIIIPSTASVNNPLSGRLYTVSGREQPPPPPPKVEYISVYITGAVATPGVITIAAGSTVSDAIKAAGGTIAGSDLAKLDLGQPLRDEMHIHVNKIAAKK